MTPPNSSPASSHALAPARLLQIFLIFALGYLLSYLYRTVNAVLAPDLVRDLGLTPGQLGALTSAYFVTFAAFQIPLGVLLDRYGPRRVESLLLVIAAAGALLFALADGFGPLVVGRALIGFGVSACLMAGFKGFSLWFPKDRLPLFNGLLMVAGGIGAVSAAAPVEFALTLTDWRGVFAVVAVMTLACAAALYLIVPEPPATGQPPASAKMLLAGVAEVFRAPRFWRVAPIVLVSQGTFLGFQGLWIGPWLQRVEGMQRAEAAGVVTLAAIGMAVGFLLSGLIADRLARRGVKLIVVGGTGMALFAGIQLLIVADIALPPALLWFCFGLVGTSSSISYAALAQAFPAHLSGRVTTAINLMAFIGAFLVQSGTGWWLDGVADQAQGLRTALTAILVLQAAGLLWLVAAGRIAAARFPGAPGVTR